MENVFVNVGNITYVKQMPKTHVTMKPSVLELNQPELRIT